MNLKRINIGLLLFLLSFFYCFKFTVSAGISIHLNIASRVYDKIPNTLKDFKLQYYAGSFHPDAFYNCLGHSLAAENAHWPPFLKVAIDYYNSNYKKKDLQNNGLKAFIYGIFTHQIADVSWHSLQSYQGFMKMISEVEFNGDYQAAHDFLDTAGDFIHLNREFQNLSKEDFKSLLNFYRQKWVYPTTDIIKIYNLLGFNKITESQLNFCMQKGYIALQGEITTILTDRSTKSRYKFYLENSPFSVVLLDKYYYGGVNQITNTIISCLKELNFWFDEDTSLNPWDLCKGVFNEHEINSNIVNEIYDMNVLSVTSYISKFPSSLTHFSQNYFPNSEIIHSYLSNKFYLLSGINNSQFGTSIKVGNYLDKMTIAISAPFENNGCVYLIPLNELFNSELKNKRSLEGDNKIMVVKLLHEDSNYLYKYPIRYGDKLFTWKFNNLEFLVVSEPGFSIFKVYLSGNLCAIIQSNYTKSNLGARGIKQWTILSQSIEDLNSDGFQDIAIGSMFSDDFNDMFQAGLVLILDGKKFFNIMQKYLNTDREKLKVPIKINIDLILFQIYEVPEVLNQKNGYEQFGSSFATTQNNILIGINSIGSVAVFEKETGIFQGILYHSWPYFKPNTVLEEERKTSRETSLYAFNNILTGKLRETEWIMISSASYSYNGKCPSCGLAYLYVIDNGEFKLITKIIPTESYQDSTLDKENIIFSYFGISMIKLAQSTVIIASSSFGDGKGALFKVDLRKIMLSETNEYTLAELIYVSDSNIGFTNFGFDSIEHFDYNKRQFLAISLSNYVYTDFVDIEKQMSGSVLILEIK